MKASKFSDAQKAFIIRQGEEGTSVAEICRKAGISQATYFNWKKKYAGLFMPPRRAARVVALTRCLSRHPSHAVPDFQPTKDALGIAAHFPTRGRHDLVRDALCGDLTCELRKTQKARSGSAAPCRSPCRSSG